ASKAVRAKAFDYLTKPISSSELIRTVANAAKVKRLDDERRRLTEENRHYRENLERLVEERTAALQESEERYRSLFEGVPTGIYRTTQQGQILDANPALVKMLGYPNREALLAINASDLYVDPEVRRREQILQEHEGDMIHCTDKQLQRRDGTIIWVRDIVQVVKDAKSQSLYHEGTLEDITERKQAEDALRESEGQLQTLIDAMPDFVCFKDGDGRWLKVNDASIRIFQLEGIEYQRKKDSELAELNSHLRGTFLTCKETDARVWKEGVLLRGEETIPHSDGSARVYDVIKVPVFHPRGERKGLVVLGRDITERVRAEESLRESEERFRQIYEHMAIGVARVSIDFQIESANEAYCNMMGYHEEELIGKHLRDITHPKTLEENLRKQEQLASGEIDHYRMEKRFIHKNGHVIHGILDATLIRDAEGKPAYFLGSVVNITERVQAEEALRESEEKFRLLAENSIDCIWKLDTKLRFTYLSPASEKLLGYKPEQMVGTKLISHFKKREFLKTGALAARAIKDYKTFTYVTFETKMLNSKNEEVDIEISSKVLLDSQGKLIGLQGITRDITERVQAEAQLKLQSHALKSAANAIVITDAKGDVQWVNPAFSDLTGYSFEEVLGHNPRVLKSGQHEEAFYKNLWDTITAGQVWHSELINKRKDGTLYYEEMTIAPLLHDNDEISNFVAIKQDITERVQAEELLQRRHRELTLLNTVIVAASSTLDSKIVLETTCRELAFAFEVPQSAAAMLNEERTASTVVAEYLAEGRSSAMDVVIPLEGNPATQYVVEHKSPLSIADAQHDPRMAAIHDTVRRRGTVSMLLLPLIVRDQVVGTLGLDAIERREFSEEDITLATSAVAAAAQALENARLYQAEQRRRLEAELLREAAQAVSTSLEINEILHLILTQLKHALVYASASVLILREDNTPELVISSGYKDEELTNIAAKDLLLSSPILRQMAIDLQPVVSADVRELDGWIFVPGAEHVRAWLGIPMVASGRMIGALMVDSEQTDFFGEADVQLTQSLAQLAAQALENARLFSEAQKRLERLSALHSIDRAITGSLDLDISLNVLLKKLLAILEIDAAIVLRYQEALHTLEFSQGLGLTTDALQHTRLQVGQGCAGKVALQRRKIFISDLTLDKNNFLESPQFEKEKFVAYYGVPLISKGELVGVLEIFHRSALALDDEWVVFLETLAEQAAIAIDNVAMFDNLQRSNMELVIAYRDTIEGWAKVLELKDMETEGHSRRVEALTIQLAKKMGVSDKKLAHIRRGALLHDIGKMGVPDSILQKPGPLTEEEWQIMRQHPVYAFEWLSTIEYLREALDIPHYHHEKWDGSGYPAGLKGERIPLPARIFAIIDVWDALRNDRPYRSAWSKEKTLAYIREQSGTHFDPRVVEAFLEIVEVTTQVSFRT
ncbi:MAG: PAS domain S-box protein, partial [Chloroflexota bacterium]|nr:PAS domain S-box protein [Chloroflexota bacterium]